MAKLYEECAKRVKVLLNDAQFKNELNDKLKTMTDVQTNPRLTDFGKEELLSDLRKEFAACIKEQSEKIRAEIKKFCNEYIAEISADDGDDHSVEVANVLHIIDLMGLNLTVEMLKTAIEPLLDSGKLLKMVYDILKTKNDNTPPGVGSYNQGIFTMLEECLGMSGEILSYVDEFEKVRRLLDIDVLVDWRVVDDYQYGVSGTILRIQDVTPYSVLCLSDNMMTVGRIYDQIKLFYPHFFK